MEQHTCTMCGKRYKWEKTLIRHQKYECQQQPQFQCPYCEHRSHWKSNIQKHIVVKHLKHLTSLLNLVEDTAVTKENGPHVCQSCGKVYQQKRTLQRHLRYECGVPPQFQCVMCPYRSKHRSHLTRHLVTVHNQLLQDAELNKGVVIS
ncbi:longitudinals lacking protein, isoforms N/O/W/X/Y-like [Homalodisca vitripennis]|uniref:longitudinals lacking protein, isoforms N/O/W/X/Y-like n=1 Tax=Homalodisca vitripennis TaxID=197043 RepID=UPI001EEB7310|nr:longitudinals lacking protein, isoforms N/O/W/X/Y-like [Homalodisca vitripennis]KAG8259222.1 hypothetical protein J6590_014691 [Homalodisca vitripennis]